MASLHIFSNYIAKSSGILQVGQVQLDFGSHSGKLENI